MTQMMRDLVEIQGGFKPSVVLPNDFLDEDHNRHFIENYIPNNETLTVFKSIRDSLQSNAEDRARLFVGTFGTGKSDLMLMIANYVTRSADDPLLKPFFERLYRLDHAKAESIYQARLNSPPYLLVLLQADAVDTFSSFILNGLAEALKEKRLEDLMGKTYYRAALDTIEKWEQNHPDNINRLKKVLETDYRRDLERLKSDLQSSRADAALKLFKEAVQKVLGLPFSATGVIKKPADAFKDIAHKLVNSNEYSGVMVIADEFTYLMEQLAKSPGAGDSKAIDNLAEAAVRSKENQIHFYVVSLESFASAQGAGLSTKALERTGGRFSEHSLKSQNTEELISAAIGKLVPPARFFEGAQGQFDDLLGLSMSLWNKETSKRNRNWLEETVVRGCFPLHPLATFCLPRLNRVLAQNERTMFRFIWDREQGVNSFIAEAKGTPEDGWMPLFTVDKLFDYFEDALEEKRPGLKLNYQDAARKLTPEQVENKLEGRLLRALVMLEIADLRADKEILRHAIGFPASRMSELELTIAQLEQASVIYPSLAGYYNLVTRGGVDPAGLKRKIEQLANDILTSPLNTLNAQHGLASVEASKYNTQRGTVRHLTARFISPNELDRPTTLEQRLKENDGVVWYVVAYSNLELEHARAKALQLTRKYNRLVVAVPRYPTDILTRLQQKHALEQLREQPDYKSAAYLLSERGMVGKGYEEAFSSARQYFDQPKNFEWYRNGRTINVLTPASLSALASTIMEDVFPATPPHKTRQHLQPEIKGTSKRYLKNAVEEILRSPFKMPISKKRGRKSGDKAILLDGAAELGYIYHEKQEAGYDVYNICPPDPRLRNSQKIWLLLEKELQKKTSWLEIVAKLSNPPYGLYPSVLQLLLATFYRYNQDYLEIYPVSNPSGAPLDITADTISKIVQTPQGYILNYTPLHDNQRKFLRGLAERALYPGRPLRLQKGETASLRHRVARLLRIWSGDKVSIVARQATQEDLAKILQKTPADVIPIAATLMEITMQLKESATATALLDTLPSKLGLPQDSSLWSEDELDGALAYLESACGALKDFSKEFRKYIVWQIGQIFGLTEIPKKEKEVLEIALRWRSKQVSGVENIQLGGAPDGRDLVSSLDDAPYSFEQAFLNALPHCWRFGLFEQWKTVDTGDKYIQRLADAKDAVEARAKELGVFSSEPKTPSEPELEGVEVKKARIDVSGKELKKEVDTPPSQTVQQEQPDNPPRADTSYAQEPQLKTSSGTAEKTKLTQNTRPTAPVKVAPASPLTLHQTTTPQTELTPKERQLKTAHEAFEIILSIFEQLPSSEQYVLWELLTNEFDPK